MADTRTVLEGIYFGEGPRWHDGRLYFSDFYQHAVIAMTADGRAERVVEVANQPSGLGWLPDGRMLIVSMVDRKLLRLENGRLVQHADLSGIATWHCNDMVVDGRGRAYVGNFGFDLEKFIAERGIGAMAEAPKATLARVDPDGKVSAAAPDLQFPNGAVVTPDGHTLIVAETMGSRLTAFDIGADGTLSNRRTWAETAPAFPDGICLDAEGAIWVANPLAPECIRVAEGGRVLARVATSQNAFACALGGAERKTLFIPTAPTSAAAEAAAAPRGKIEAVEVSVAGAGWP
jgi:sugar lactone lactonase YvrE